MRHVMAALLALVLASHPAAASCEGTGGTEQVSIELLFGRATPGGPIAEPEWQDFLAATVTPRFPDGLTVLDGYGQWRNAAGRITHEPSTVVWIIAPKADDLLARIEAIRGAYRTRFQQESVGLVVASVCAAF
jgi:hypothetical protein